MLPVNHESAHKQSHLAAIPTDRIKHTCYRERSDHRSTAGSFQRAPYPSKILKSYSLIAPSRLVSIGLHCSPDITCTRYVRTFDQKQNNATSIAICPGQWTLPDAPDLPIVLRGLRNLLPCHTSTRCGITFPRNASIVLIVRLICPPLYTAHHAADLRASSQAYACGHPPSREFSGRSEVCCMWRNVVYRAGATHG
ncbi:hypothetical protein DAEQUDRAFT_223755 [Daedalea quercina L-15889]|uniref:Uncharacterized protein n=1 Tax=Daedalea quercina L-15889 TaxID=1314783 RepID=A0A165QYX9_9APHY|nr:hypothetical protein DAEQUDRAFT_223755 [Daedalea quercina L-15889]